jgi:hypothetical protein
MTDYKVMRWPSDTEEYYQEITAEMFESFLLNVFEIEPKDMHPDALIAAYSVFFYHLRFMRDEMIDRGLTFQDDTGHDEPIICFPRGVRLPRGLRRASPADDIRPSKKETLN